MPGVSRHASSEAVEEKHPGPSPKLVVTLVMGVNHNTSSYVYPFPQLLFIYPHHNPQTYISSFELAIFKDNYVPVRVVNCTSSHHCEQLQVVLYHNQKMEHSMQHNLCHTANHQEQHTSLVASLKYGS